MNAPGLDQKFKTGGAEDMKLSSKTVRYLYDGDGHSRVKTIDLIESLKLSSYSIVTKIIEYFEIELVLGEKEVVIK